jgi:hypothetical protein
MTDHISRTYKTKDKTVSNILFFWQKAMTNKLNAAYDREG